MKKFFLSYLVASSFFSSAPNSFASRELTQNEIALSADRIEGLANKHYHTQYHSGSLPIDYEKQMIGRVGFQKDVIHIAFTDFAAEWNPDLDKYTKSLEASFKTPELSAMNAINLNEKTYANIYSVFNGTREDVLSWTRENCNNLLKIHKHIRIIVEGYGQGSGVAALMALHLKQQLDVGGNPDKGSRFSVNVLSYAPVNIFTEEAGKEYIRKIGYDNHINFVAEEDALCRVFNPSLNPKGAHPNKYLHHSIKALMNARRSAYGEPYPYVGTTLWFSANDSKSFQQSLEQYKGAATMPSPKWLAHNAKTYKDLAPTAFYNFIFGKIKDANTPPR